MARDAMMSVVASYQSGGQAWGQAVAERETRGPVQRETRVVSREWLTEQSNRHDTHETDDHGSIESIEDQ